ncbi:MAG: hypothetical protein A3B91_01365 [Candidatus Yanofskybacteria bacterium RIFCSPHIGHO2_02_FULL_41_29]|nr:MAG: hypothetical protein A3B91_01365 [Candidatus Yanofskybacteria bacterium RIFCSPHIGHO2_02_FULL_41_29]OGN16794.1 MAG: hypothetical protein A3F48_00965 [Candidatus Yanofskybacteria bacterium RIFCSPHIGHO2_12_FULL_41_9]OGN30429.1 MAG: hypothetical protein A3H54_00150 [Candidatus Yanofskybacteria bacterium RIFCSPLOWO2_02_FULL_41_13]
MMKKLTIGLAQIGNEFSDGQCYLPPSIGYLKAYAQKYARDSNSFEFLQMVYKRLTVESAVAKLIDAQIVAFSVYVWNFELSCAIARELKRQKPEIIIVFGGPHVPDGLKRFGREKKSAGLIQLTRLRKSFTETFHRDYPFIDIACHGEGEAVFLDILERLLDGNYEREDIPSISYLRKDGTFVHNPRRPRIVDLGVVPSPYQSGIFDDLIKSFPEQKWIVLLETNRGCPYACTFCDWGGATEDKLAKFPLEQVCGDIEWIGRHQIGYTFIGDANFGILERDVKIAEQFAKIREQYGFPKAIATQNAKNPKDHSFEALAILDRSGLKTDGLMSLQSTNAETLRAIRRDNMKVEAYQARQNEMAAKGTMIVTDMIMAMPNETYDSFADGISNTIAGGQHNRIHFNIFTILPNAEAANPEYMEEYGMKTVSIKILTVHGKKEETPDGIDEWQKAVVATKTMPKEDWIRTRVFTWMSAFLHFDKMFQIPLIVMNQIGGISYRELIELFSEGNYRDVSNHKIFLPEEEFPVLASIRQFLLSEATKITQGQEEYSHSGEWLDIWWPADAYAMIKLYVNGRLSDFYEEAQRALRLMRNVRSAPVNDIILDDAIRLNRALLKLPFQDHDLTIKLNYRVWEFYRNIFTGQPAILEEGPAEYCIDRTTESWDSLEEWLRKVVWWCFRNGAYLYTIRPNEPV